MSRFSYKHLKIQTKFTLIILIALLTPFIILTVTFSDRLYDMIISETIKDAQYKAAYTSPLISTQATAITDLAGEIMSDPYYERLFYSATTRNPDEICFTQEAADFKNSIELLEKENNVSIRIYMGFPENSTFFSADASTDVFFPMSFAKGTYWYGIFQGSKGSRLYCPPAYLSHHEKDYLGDEAYITYVTSYYEENIYPCYVAIYYSSDNYKQILEDNIASPAGVSYIINEREEIVATTNITLSATYRLKYSDIENSLLSSNSFISREILNETVYVAFYYLPDTKWFIVTVIPEAPIISHSTNIIYRFTMIVVACVLLALFLAIILSRSITGRISKVIHQMILVKNGPPTPMAAADSNDEVGELIDTYNYMANEMQNLILKEQKTAEQLRIAEFNALQAQINPHFLYNTMDMISWMAKDGRVNEVSEVVQRLSRFYKLTLSKKNTINSIADELEHTEIYVELMNMRHSNSINLVTDMPDELTKYTIPKLTLQPIIENAILHGILEKLDKTGTIIITGWEEDSDILILISDDGVGIPANKMINILSSKPVGPTKGSNVAISNIHHRLKLLYGEKYGLSYKSIEGNGTEVTIRIPAIVE